MSRSVKFTADVLRNIANNIKNGPHGRFSISKHVKNDLHLRKTESLKKKRQASILIPLCNRNGEASILYTLRSQTVGTHKGQVSFPGGMNNPDEDDISTAIRETIEEIGEDVGDIEIIGLGQTIYSITGVLVTPVIGFIKNDVGDLRHFTPETNEVEEIFTRSLAKLNDNTYKTYETYERDGKKATMPVYGGNVNTDGFLKENLVDIIAPNGDIMKVRRKRIWGLTGIITEGVLNVINQSVNIEK
jgi:8-oxo-dGTP pyrophosphatase MutT (NUDIX family)